MAFSLTIRRLLTNQPVDLPVFHPIAIRLQLLLETHDFSISEVIELANEDQVLAGQILKLANSTVYMGRVRTETIKEAVIRLGAQHIANIAMAVSQSGQHMSQNAVINGFLRSLWMHSHACAVGSRWLAINTGYPQYAERAYMAGLLHDVGKLYLLKALERLNRLGVAQAVLEENLLLEIFDALHVEQGCRLMEHWNLPRIYRDVVARHHDEVFDPADILLATVRFANPCCRSVGLGFGPGPATDVRSAPENVLLQLAPEKFDDLHAILRDSQTPLPI